MKGAGGRGALANAGDADSIGDPLKPMRQQCAVHDRNHRSQVADHGQKALPGSPTMDIAISPSHWTERRTQICANSIQNWFAESQAASSIANKRRKYVSFMQRQANRGAQGFLAAPEEHAAMDFAHAIKTGEFVIQKPRQQHEAICLDV